MRGTVGNSQRAPAMAGALWLLFEDIQQQVLRQDPGGSCRVAGHRGHGIFEGALWPESFRGGSEAGEGRKEAEEHRGSHGHVGDGHQGPGPLGGEAHQPGRGGDDAVGEVAHGEQEEQRDHRRPHDHAVQAQDVDR
ncbi:hypothetical protein PCS70012_02351, partial [Streptococcus pneumoniae PCS70012]